MSHHVLLSFNQNLQPHLPPLVASPMQQSSQSLSQLLQVLPDVK